MHKSYFKKPKKKKGSKTEAPVQAALNTYLDLKGLYYFRIPDELFSFLIKHLKIAMDRGNKTEEMYIKNILGYLRGWPDNMVFKVLTEKYLLACPIECKSATGKTHGRQKIMSRDLNYQIPRSPEDCIKIVENFINDHEIVTECIEDAQDLRKE